ncbi:MAG: chloride channel protein [Planctomycetes bacterium]|nr:chloride channel protein [Planctomycetota bacterium]MCB9869102.1 chloride channel protein [Planctomycetota bacterium]MCB9889275.1 chloride channel protein [Planctomycetota bacterium]
MPRAVWRSASTVYGLAIVVGAIGGAGAVAFEYLAQLVSWAVMHQLVGYVPNGPRGEPALFPHRGHSIGWLPGLVIAPALGGLVSGWLCRKFAPEAAGHGTDAVIDAYHNRDGAVRARVPLVKALATALSLGTGGSGGREGPIAQIGAGFGSLLGGMLNLTPRQRRILLAVGMGAGVGAIFRAPLAGALFAAEILYREAEFEAEVLIPSVIASAIAYCVYCGWFDDFGNLFHSTEGFVFEDLRELVPYTALALLLTPAVFLYTEMFFRMEQLSKRVRLPRPIVAALGALLCGAVGVAACVWSGEERALSVLSYGYGVIQDALDQQITGWTGVRLLVLIAVLKMLTTSLTITSGGSGGVFGPSMVIGACLGGAVGVASQELGMTGINPGCFVIVGMAGFFSGAAHTPISTLIMVSEMTGSYELLLPSMWVCGITFLLCQRWTIYTKQVPNRAFSNAHRGEFLVPLLQKLSVADVFESGRSMTTVPSNAPLAEVVRLIARTHDDYFPVLDDDGRFVGIFSAHDVREFTFDDTVHHLAIAADLMTVDPIVLTMDMDLHAALAEFDRKNLDELPVVESADPRRLLGMLRRRAVLRAYNAELTKLKELQREH